MAYIPVPNQSVSGTLGSSIIGLPPVNINVGGNPVTTVNPVPVQPPATGFLPVTNVGSVITVSQGSVATVIVGGSISASFTPPANQSVSGTVDILNIPSVLMYQSPGSVLAVSGSFSPAPNQSVSGTVQTDVRGSVATVIIGGSITTAVSPFNSSVQVLNFPANQSVSGAVSISNLPTSQNVNGSVVSFQGTSPWIVTGSIQASTGNSSVQVLNFPSNQSVSGKIDIGPSSVWLINPNQSVSGAVSISNFPTTQNVSGSVVATQGTTPWQVVSSLAGGIFPVSGSVAAVITNTNVNVGGSVSAWLQSSNASIITVGTAAPNQSVSGTVQTDVRASVAVIIIGGSIAASFTPPVNQSVSGTVGASIIGTAPVTQGGTWISSVFGSVSVVGTIPVTQSGTWQNSIAGGYAKGTASVISGLGLLALGIRNDTMSSTLSSSDGQHINITVGPVGEQIVANAPINKWVSGNASIMTSAGGSVMVLPAPSAGIFTYLTGIQFGGFGPQSVLLTIAGGLGSVLGKYPIPAGGSNTVATILNPIKSGPGTVVTASIGGAGATTSSVFVGIQGFNSNT